MVGRIDNDHSRERITDRAIKRNNLKPATFRPRRIVICIQRVPLFSQLSVSLLFLRFSVAHAIRIRPRKNNDFAGRSGFAVERELETDDEVTGSGRKKKEEKNSPELVDGQCAICNERNETSARSFHAEICIYTYNKGGA